jgi:hypothetical protein
VPAALSSATIRAALLFGEQQPVAGAVSAQVIALANGGVRALVLTPWQVLALALVTAVLLGSGAGLWLSRAAPALPEAEAPVKEQVRGYQPGTGTGKGRKREPSKQSGANGFP